MESSSFVQLFFGLFLVGFVSTASKPTVVQFVLDNKDATTTPFPSSAFTMLVATTSAAQADEDADPEVPSSSSSQLPVTTTVATLPASAPVVPLPAPLSPVPPTTSNCVLQCRRPTQEELQQVRPTSPAMNMQQGRRRPFPAETPNEEPEEEEETEEKGQETRQPTEIAVDVMPVGEDGNGFAETFYGRHGRRHFQRFPSDGSFGYGSGRFQGFQGPRGGPWGSWGRWGRSRDGSSRGSKGKILNKMWLCEKKCT